MPHVHAEQRLQSLLDIMHLLMGAVDPEEVLTVILTAAVRLYDAEGCSLALLDPTQQELVFIAMAGPAQVDVRLLAATNRDLHQAMQRGTFREDLYYRLNVVTLTLPPLRDRRDDIPTLVTHFLVQYGREVHRPGLRITPEALALLQAYAWPGNVRELQNAIERAAVLVPDLLLTVTDFPPALRQASRQPAATMPPCSNLEDPRRRTATAPIPQTLVAAPALPAEVAQMQKALLQTGGNVARAARLLGVSRDTMRYRMQRYGLARPCLEAVAPPGAAAPQQVPQSGHHG